MAIKIPIGKRTIAVGAFVGLAGVAGVPVEKAVGAGFDEAKPLGVAAAHGSVFIMSHAIEFINSYGDDEGPQSPTPLKEKQPQHRQKQHKHHDTRNAVELGVFTGELQTYQSAPQIGEVVLQFANLVQQPAPAEL